MDSTVKAAFDQLAAAAKTTQDAITALYAALSAPGTGGDAGVVMTAPTVISDTAWITWTVANPQDVAGWRIGRDGTDAGGGGPWNTTLSPGTRSFTFSSLKPSSDYVITLVPTESNGSAGTPTSVTITTKPGTTLPPVDPGTGTSYAAKLGWGEPTWRDEFDYEGDPKSELWMPCGKKGEGWDGHNKNGRRMPECTTVKGGLLVMTGRGDGDTGWLSSTKATTYGRWEIRSRSRNTGSNGAEYHPLHLIWPTEPEKWPDNGELDLLETTSPGGKQAGAWLHYPHRSGIPIQQAGPFSKDCDLSQFHTFNFEWDKTGVRGWIDGDKWYDVRDGGGPYGRKNIQDMTKGMLKIQLDNFSKDGPWRTALFETDYVRFYPVK